MKSIKEQEYMKKFIFTVIAAVILSAVLMSCQSSTVIDDDSTEPETTEAEAVSAEDTTGAAAAEYDFSNASVSGYVLLRADGEKKLDDFVEGADCFLQKDGIAEVLEDGTVRAVSAGVTLISYKSGEGDKVVACCVLKDGVRPDSSGSSPQLFEVGESTSISGDAKRDSSFSSSDEAVATVDNSATVSFISPGYAVITVEGISVPSFHSYIVFER